MLQSQRRSSDELHSPEPKSVGEKKGPDRRPVQPSPTFYGKSSWEAFLAQFDIAGRMNGWNDVEKASFLATSLQGTATLILSNLSEQDRGDYKILVSALSSRFGVSQCSELARAKSKTRLQRKDESLPEFVEAIENLTRRAYPDASLELQEVLARDHFIDTLTEDELRLRIRQAKPSLSTVGPGKYVGIGIFSVGEST